MLPIITPPFVIGLALILLFGRSGAVTALLSDWFGIPRSRWIYGLPGVLHRAAARLHADRLPGADRRGAGHQPVARGGRADAARAALDDVFRTVTLPLMRPGPRQRVPARLRREPGGFRQSAGARRQLRGAVDQDLLRRGRRRARPGRAAVLAHRAARLHARRVLCCSSAGSASASYTTVTGKGDAGLPLPLPRRVALAVLRASRMPWAVFTLVIYVDHPRRRLRARTMGRDYTPTLEHYLTGFGIEMTPRGPVLLRLGLELVLHHDRDRRDRRAAHRRDRPADRLAADAPELRRPARVRVRHAC